MRFAVVLFALHFFLTGHAQTSTDNKILATELERFGAMIQKDTNHLQKLLADDLMYMHSNSLKEDKKGHIHAIATGKIEYKKMDRESVQIRRYGNIALTNGNVRVQGVLNGTPFEVFLAYSATYKKHHKTWQLLNWQSTRIP